MDYVDSFLFIEILEQRLKESDEDDTIDELEVKAEMKQWFNND